MGYYTNLLKDIAVLKTVNGFDENSRPNIIALDEIDCKIEFKHVVTIGPKGNELLSAGRLFTEAVIKVDDILEIKNKEFRVINVTPCYPLADTLCAINEVYFA